MRQLTLPLPTILLVTAVSCVEASGRIATERDGPLVRELGAVSAVALPWNVRLSVESAFPACGSDSLALERLHCGTAALRRESLAGLAAVASRANAAMEAGVSVDALHAATLVDLLVADTAGKALDQSISRLEMITGLSPGRSMAWVDLSGAYLMRASARRDGRALLAALDAASRALEIDSASVAASYNRALALDLLAMDVEAARAWRHFLRLHSRSPWSTAARQRLARDESVRQPERPAVDAPADSLRHFVTNHSFEARLFAWEALLGGWGARLLAGDTTAAESLLRAASVIANDIAARFADSSLVSAIASIEFVRRTRAERALAESHVAFARGRDSTYANNHQGAEPEFAAVLSNPATSSALRDWATLAHANALLYRGRTREAERLTETLLARLDQRTHPSLAGRAWWMLAVIALREVRDATGLAANDSARRYFELAGERDNVAATFSLLAERALKLGDDEGFSTMVDVMRALRSYPTGLWRHNALYILANNATRLGLDRAAMALVDEDAASASGSRAASVAELRLIRARSLWERGDTTRALDALALASRTIDSLPFEDLRRAFRAEYSFTLASGPLFASGDRALRMLDTAIALHGPARRVTKLIPLYVARARVALSLGSLEAAEADLSRAAGLHGIQRDSITSLPERAAMLARAREVFNRLALLRLSRGDTVGALETLERGRASLAPVSAGRTEPGPRDDAGQVLDFALIDDTLLAWTVDRRGVSVQRTPVPRDSVEDVIERVRVAMELQSPDVVLRPLLTRLYDWFIRPNDGRLAGDTSSLAIVSDAALAEVPFAALFDSTRGQYLVERRPLRWAPALADARRPARRRSGARALIVSSPQLDWRVFPALPALPGAERETQSVATFHAGATVLSGPRADSASVTSALQSADHFHFAGHALFDDARPHRSRLAMMPRGIDAAAIAKLDLRRLRLAVLSACETVRAPERRGAGFSGLTEAFLAAGAGGVIGTLWPVDDALTGEFMNEFYRAWRRHGDAAAALRDAQLSMMQATDTPATPSAWAGFRLAGR